MLLLLVLYKPMDFLYWGDIVLLFRKCKRQIQLSLEDVLCVVCMQAAHLWVVQLTQNMQQGIL